MSRFNKSALCRPRLRGAPLGEVQSRGIFSIEGGSCLKGVLAEGVGLELNRLGGALASPAGARGKCEF